MVLPLQKNKILGEECAEGPLKNIDNGEYFYFVHLFEFLCNLLLNKRVLY